MKKIRIHIYLLSLGHSSSVIFDSDILRVSFMGTAALNPFWDTLYIEVHATGCAVI